LLPCPARLFWTAGTTVTLTWWDTDTRMRLTGPVGDGSELPPPRRGVSDSDDSLNVSDGGMLCLPRVRREGAGACGEKELAAARRRRDHAWQRRGAHDVVTTGHPDARGYGILLRGGRTSDLMWVQ
jgi:hypothetical protein